MSSRPGLPVFRFPTPAPLRLVPIQPVPPSRPAQAPRPAPARGERRFARLFPRIDTTQLSS